MSMRSIHDKAYDYQHSRIRIALKNIVELVADKNLGSKRHASSILMGRHAGIKHH